MLKIVYDFGTPGWIRQTAGKIREMSISYVQSLAWSAVVSEIVSREQKLLLDGQIDRVNRSEVATGLADNLSNYVGLVDELVQEVGVPRKQPKGG